MSEFSKNPDKIEQRRAVVETALAPGGVLHEIAKSAIAENVELSPDNVADILLPPKQPGERYHARWERLEDAPQIIKELAEANQQPIYDLSGNLDIRKEESLPWPDLKNIDPDKAIWMVEGGANRTSVVRRQLALEAMEKIYGEDNEHESVYQFGSDRPIPKFRIDQSSREKKTNSEYAIAQEIAGNYFPKDKETHLPKEEITEFELNLASAMEAGYRPHPEPVNNNEDMSGIMAHISKMTSLYKDGAPDLVLIKPKQIEGGLVDGVNAVLELLYDYEPKYFEEGDRLVQHVIVTNGQYRAKDELQASRCADNFEVDTLPPVALGDEPGFTVEHHGKEIKTAERPPMVYVNEMVILHRLQS